MRSDLIARYTIGEPVYENEFIVYPAEDKRMDRSVYIVEALAREFRRFEHVLVRHRSLAARQIGIA